jgi:hypothetical protein
MKNKLHYSFLLCLLVILILLVVSKFGEFSVGPIAFKKYDLFGNIKEPAIGTVVAKEQMIPDSVVVKQDSIAQQIQEKCKPGLVCIEDYSKKKTALRKFFQALKAAKNSKTAVRIAFYGDSFIEGDVFCGSFRDTLQSIYGGRGVGFVPITSEVTYFRKTIRHKFANWQTESLVKKTPRKTEVGPSGYSFIPTEGNWVEFKPSNLRYLKSFSEIKLYYKTPVDGILNFSVDSIASADALEKSGKMQQWTYRGKDIHSVKFEFYPYDSISVYGASFEDGGGVYVDNFSLRGNSGMNLTTITPEMYKQFNKFRKYKLVILQFGLNLISEQSLNYNSYAERMVYVITQMKKALPDADFLLLSVSDRSSNVNGDYKTMAAIPAMRDAQRLIAQQTQIAFWDMFEAMGGENSMVKFVSEDPPLAAKDYTHLNFIGGKKLAGSLVKSLVYEASRKK